MCVDVDVDRAGQPRRSSEAVFTTEMDGGGLQVTTIPVVLDVSGLPAALVEPGGGRFTLLSGEAAALDDALSAGTALALATYKGPSFDL